MKNGFIGSEQTTITCAHIIDPVWNFFGEKDPEKSNFLSSNCLSRARLGIGEFHYCGIFDLFFEFLKVQ